MLLCQRETDLLGQRKWGPSSWERVGPRALGGPWASGKGELWAPVSVGGGVHYENSYAQWQNYKWEPKVVSKHVVRVLGERRKRKVRDIQIWAVPVMAVSSQTQHKGSHLPWNVSFWIIEPVPAWQPPTSFPDVPDGHTDLFQHNRSRIIPLLALG